MQGPQPGCGAPERPFERPRPPAGCHSAGRRRMWSTRCEAAFISQICSVPRECRVVGVAVLRTGAPQKVQRPRASSPVSLPPKKRCPVAPLSDRAGSPSRQHRVVRLPCACPSPANACSYSRPLHQVLQQHSTEISLTRVPAARPHPHPPAADQGPAPAGRHAAPQPGQLCDHLDGGGGGEADRRVAQRQLRGHGWAGRGGV